MSAPIKLLGHLQKKAQAAAYGNPIYRKILDQGPTPAQFVLSLPDPWPGDAIEGQRRINAAHALADSSPHSNEFAKKDYGHAFLRDLRAVGTETARRKAQDLILHFLNTHSEWDEESWEVDVLGERLAHLVAFHDFYLQTASINFTSRLLPAMARQMRHLHRAFPGQPLGLFSLSAIRGLIFAPLALGGNERSLALALDLLLQQLQAEILSDGGHISRSPQTHLEFLQRLIEIRQALRTAHIEVPHLLQNSIEKMVPALKFYRYGDGGLAVFNGAGEGQELLIETVLTASEARRRALFSLPHTRYERLMAGRSLLLADAGAPPPPPYDANAHAGLLAIEFSAGKERILVNCGPEPYTCAGGEWRMATAATAAHNCLTLNQSNALPVLPEGGLGPASPNVAAQRYEQDGLQFIELAHDAYANTNNVFYQRLLRLSADGEALRGWETITGPAGNLCTIRWHLHPSVQAAELQGGNGILLRLPSGNGWRFRLEENELFSLVLEPSLYCPQGTPKRTLQIKAEGVTKRDITVLGWSLTREKKSPPILPPEI